MQQSAHPRHRPSPRARVTLRAAALTHTGLVREHNEDAFFFSDLNTAKRKPTEVKRLGPAGALLGVCDGMGGAAAGEVASAMAADEITASLERAPVATGRTDLACVLASALEVADRKIRDEAKRTPDRHGMGTTCSCAVFRNGELVLAQAGDSRAYVYRKGALTQVTKDQSYVRHLVELGHITPEEARFAPNANIIMQSLGGKEAVDVELSVVSVRRGDRLLVCSDGLTGMVPDEAIRGVLACFTDLGEVCERLVGLANAAGGRDNITVVVCEFDGDGLPDAASDDVIEYQPLELSASDRHAQPTADTLDPIAIPGLRKRRYAAVAALLVLVLGALGLRAAMQPVSANSVEPRRAATRLERDAIAPPVLPAPERAEQPEPEAAPVPPPPAAAPLQGAKKATSPRATPEARPQAERTPKKWEAPSDKVANPF